MEPKILLVEDEAVIAMEMQKMLQRKGYNVCGLAMNGEQAVAMAGNLKPDIIIMDINLPLLNGIEASRRIKSKNDTSIIFLTGYSSDDVIAQAQRLSPVNILHKPVNLKDLFVAIQSILPDARENL